MQQQQHPYRRGPQARNTLRGGHGGLQREGRQGVPSRTRVRERGCLDRISVELQRRDTIALGHPQLRIRPIGMLRHTYQRSQRRRHLVGRHNPLGSRRGAARDLARSAPGRAAPARRQRIYVLSGRGQCRR